MRNRGLDSTVDMDQAPVIPVRHLTKRYADFVAVNDISFEVQPGEIFGIVGPNGAGKTSAIVLLDRIGIEIEENGLSEDRAVVEAAQRRFRPILLTTATTVAGLLPLWFGGGPMYEPMAIAIIFGLIFATLLTLGVVPILYSLFFRVSFKGFVY